LGVPVTHTPNDWRQLELPSRCGGCLATCYEQNGHIGLVLGAIAKDEEMLLGFGARQVGDSHLGLVLGVIARDEEMLLGYGGGERAYASVSAAVLRPCLASTTKQSRF
jgi:hypothetical protein